MAYKLFAMVLTKLQSPFMIFAFLAFFGHACVKNQKKCAFLAFFGPVKRWKIQNSKKGSVNLLEPLQRKCTLIFRSNEEFAREKIRFSCEKGLVIFWFEILKIAKIWPKMARERAISWPFFFIFLQIHPNLLYTV